VRDNQGCLAQNPVFAPAEAAARDCLVRRSSLRRYEADQLVLAEGEPSEQIFALVQGSVRVFHVSPCGDEVALKIFAAPAIFGEAEALSGIPYLEYVRTIDDVQLLVMPTEALLDFLRGEPECTVRMLMDVSARLAIAAYNEKSLAFNPATIRLANYLLDYASWTGSGAAELRVALNQDEMAAAIGVSRRSVAKDIIAWQKDGLLERQGADYLIRDPEALRRYADPERLGLVYSLEDLRRRVGDPPEA
jgi:CRP-like cAMP-binding protein